jgi:hypothetical protein
MELTLYRLEFNVAKTTQRITVLTNVEQFGLTMEGIFDDWINHSADLTPENFCKFIRSINSDIICISEAQYNELYAE